MHYVAKHMRLSTLVSGNIMVYADIRGIPGEVASNDSGVIESIDFQGFRTLRLRYLGK